jgi:hypothetical protein
MTLAIEIIHCLAYLLLAWVLFFASAMSCFIVLMWLINPHRNAHDGEHRRRREY